jgi:autotransporter-associated beta strand protein
MTRPLVVVVVAVVIFSGPARGQTWTGAANDGGNWNNAANWSPATVPNSATADTVFPNAGVGNVTLLSSVLARSLTFTNTTGTYDLTSSSATISNLTNITVGPGVTGTETINLASVATGSLLFGSSGPVALVVANNSYSGTLVIGPNTVIGTPGNGGLIVGGPGMTQINGSFANTTSPNNQVVGGLLMGGPGNLSLSGSGANLSGGLTLAGGTLTLDFTSNTAVKVGSGNLTSTGGTVTIQPNTGTGVTQNFASTSLNAGDTELTVGSGIMPTFGLGAMTRASGATFSNTSGSAAITTTTGNTNGLWGNGPAFATSGAAWLTNNGSGVLTNLPAGPTNAFSPGTNTDVSGSVSPAVFTTNSLRFNTPNSTLTLSGVFDVSTVQSGGILVTANAASPNFVPTTINGGTLASGQNELIVHAYSDVMINSDMLAPSGLTKTGPGNLILGGMNDVAANTGPWNINRGNLVVTYLGAVPDAPIHFNDNRESSQTFRFQLGNGVGGTVIAPIQFSANGSNVASLFPNVLDTFGTENAFVTLAGVISSAPGTVTPIRIDGDLATYSSGINLTAVNTFTGDIQLYVGGLGINSDASLGNAANTLRLDDDRSLLGGLTFLSGGITVFHHVDIYSITRIICNGSDVNTIASSITGTLPVLKDGTGTLVLSGINSQNGVTINAGTVQVATDVNLGAAAGNVSVGSGAIFSVTGTFATNRSVALGPLTGNLPGTSTIDVAAGHTLTLNGQVSGAYGALQKTSPGTLVLNNTTNTYGGGTIVQAGTLQVAGDGSLGAAGTPVTVAGAGTLIFAGSTSTTRTFNLNSGTLSLSAGVLTFNGANVFGGFLTGPGTFAISGGAALSGVTTYASTAISVNGASSFTNFSSGGPLAVASSAAGPISFTRFANQGSGSITIGAVNVVNASDFQTYGTLTINPATISENFSQTTLIKNVGTSQLFFNGGSRTFIGTPNTAVFPNNWPDTSLRGTPTFVAGIDLHGQNAMVAGGLFVNNGYVEDSTNSFTGTATVVADFGSLVKGAGFFQNTVVTQNGGKFQAGNSPGAVTFGKFVLGPGGVANYVFAIDDATGVAGPTPDADGQVRGWGLVKAISREAGITPTTGDFTWTATAADKLLVSLETLVNPTTVGVDVPGLMEHFDPTLPYVWPAFKWTGSYAGPVDVATLDAATAFDTSGFANPIGGTFGWALDTTGHTLSLTFTPSAVPEPSALVLSGIAAVSAAFRPRRRQAGLGRRP